MRLVLKTINNTIRIALGMNYFLYGYAYEENDEYLFYIPMDCFQYMVDKGIPLEQNIKLNKLNKNFSSYHLFEIKSWPLEQHILDFDIPSELLFYLPDWIEVLKKWSSSYEDSNMVRLEELAILLNEQKHIPEDEKVKFFQSVLNQFLPKHIINTVFLTTIFNPLLSIYMRGVV